ncbi:MAG: TetR/AcrR family transcriptional regulator [Thermoplasmata archaeon]
MCPRSYDMRRRSKETTETRLKIVRAAIEQVQRTVRGEPFTLEAVAHRAGVAPMTVYNQFGSKRGLVGAVLDSVADAEFQRGLDRAFSREDPTAGMEAFVRTMIPFYQRYRVLFRTGRAIARLDPGLFRAIRVREQRRRGGLKTLLRRRAARFDAAQEKRLLDVLEALTGFDFFDALAPVRGSSEVTERAVVAQVEAAIAQATMAHRRPVR